MARRKRVQWMEMMPGTWASGGRPRRSELKARGCTASVSFEHGMDRGTIDPPYRPTVFSFYVQRRNRRTISDSGSAQGVTPAQAERKAKRAALKTLARICPRVRGRK